MRRCTMGTSGDLGRQSDPMVGDSQKQCWSPFVIPVGDYRKGGLGGGDDDADEEEEEEEEEDDGGGSNGGGGVVVVRRGGGKKFEM